MTARFFCAASAAFVFLGACADAGAPGLRIEPTLQVVAGGNQTATVAEELPQIVAVLVTNKATSQPAPGIIINWVALDGGSVFAAMVPSGSDGMARQRWTLGQRAGPQRLVARALDPETGAVAVDDTVFATGEPDVASIFQVTFGPNPHPMGLNHLAVGDTGLVVYWYSDQYGNEGAPCTDGGSPDRVIWSSADSAALLPLGTVVVLSDGWHATQVYARESRQYGVDILGVGIACTPGPGPIGGGVSYVVR